MKISRLVRADRFTLIPGYELRRAKPIEIQKIRELLAPTERGLLGLHYLPWECQRLETDQRVLAAMVLHFIDKVHLSKKDQED
jgi:hypothetical protein